MADGDDGRGGGGGGGGGRRRRLGGMTGPRGRGGDHRDHSPVGSSPPRSGRGRAAASAAAAEADGVRIDAESVCDAASRGDVEGVRSCLLPQTAAAGAGGGCAATRRSGAADALHDAIFGDGDVDVEGNSGSREAASSVADGAAAGPGAEAGEDGRRAASVDPPLRLLDDAGGAVRSRPEHALRALLMLPPWSDPPWRAAEATVLAVRRRRRGTMIGKRGAACFSSRRTQSSCLSEVRMFVTSVGRCGGGLGDGGGGVGDDICVDETDAAEEGGCDHEQPRERRRRGPSVGDGSDEAAETPAREDTATSTSSTSKKTVEEIVLERLLSLALLAAAPYLERRTVSSSSSSSDVGGGPRRRNGGGGGETTGGVLLPAELLLPSILSASVRLESRVDMRMGRRPAPRRKNPRGAAPSSSLSSSSSSSLPHHTRPTRRRIPLSDTVLSSLFPPVESGGDRRRGGPSSSSDVVGQLEEEEGADKTTTSILPQSDGVGSAGGRAKSPTTGGPGIDAGGCAEMDAEDAFSEDVDDADPELLLPLLSLAVDCAPFLRPTHWESARRSVLSCLHVHVHDDGDGAVGSGAEGGPGNDGRGRRRRRRRRLLPPADYAGLLRQCLGLLSLRPPPPTSPGSCQNGEDEESMGTWTGGGGRTRTTAEMTMQSRWEDAVVRVYEGAASLARSGGGAAALATAEAILRSSLSQLPPSSSARLAAHLERLCRFRPPSPPLSGGRSGGGDIGEGALGEAVGRRKAVSVSPPSPWATANVSLSLLSSTEIPGETHRLAASALLGGGRPPGDVVDPVASRVLHALVELPLHCCMVGGEESGTPQGAELPAMVEREVHESFLASSSRARKRKGHFKNCGKKISGAAPARGGTASEATTPSEGTSAVGEALDVADVLDGTHYAGSGGFESSSAGGDGRFNHHHRRDGLSGIGVDRGRHLSLYSRCCAKLVWRSLHVGGRGRSGLEGGRLDEDGTAGRGSLWTNAAWSILSSSGPMPPGGGGPHAYVLAVVALVCVFFEVPRSRRSVVGGLVRGLTGRSDHHGRSGEAMTDACNNEGMQLLLCAVCSVLVSSVVRGNRDSDCFSDCCFGGPGGENDPRAALDPIADLLGDFSSLAPLPPRIAVRLLRALLPLPSAREKVLSMSRKLLSSRRYNVGWGGHGGAAGGGYAIPDRTNAVAKTFAVEGLIGLTECGILIDRKYVGGGGGKSGSTAKDANTRRLLDECGHEALSILCDVIVWERPPLSLSVRAHVFRELSIRAAGDGGRGPFSRFVSGQLLRASLRRLLQFFVVMREESPHSSGKRDGGDALRFPNLGRTGCGPFMPGNLERMCNMLQFDPRRCMVDWTYSAFLRSNDSDSSSRRDRGGVGTCPPCEDVDGVVRLVVTLLASFIGSAPGGDGGVGGGGADSSSSAAELVRGNLLAIIANDGDSGDDHGGAHGEENMQQSMPSSGKVGPNAPSSKEQIMLGFEVAIALGCLRGVLRCLIGEDRQLEDDGQGAPREECFELQRVLFTAFQRATIKTQIETRKPSQSRSTALKARMATMSSTLTSSELPPREVDGETCSQGLSALKLGLVDAFLDFILIPNTDPIHHGNCDAVQISDFDSCRMILNAVCRLLACKNMGVPSSGVAPPHHHAANAAIRLETKKNCPAEERNRKLLSAAAFFRLTSRLVGHLCGSSACRETPSSAYNAPPRFEVDSLLLAMHYHCGLVDMVLTDRQPKLYRWEQTSACAVSLTVALWQLYRGTASESAGCYWLNIFEKIARGEDCHDSEQVEIVASERVRDMRCMVLRSLSNALKFLIHTTSDAPAWEVLMRSMCDQLIGATKPIRPGDALALDQCRISVDGGVTKSGNSQETSPDSVSTSVSKQQSMIPFWFQLVVQLSKDLRSGLDCTSGGMSSVLYKLFLDCIERVLDVISLYPDHIFQQVDAKSLTEFCHESSTNLWRILCTYALTQATLLKRTLRLGISRIPSFCGRVLPVWAEASFVENHLAVTASRDCLEKLEEWYCERAQNGEWIYSASEDEEEEEEEGGGRFELNTKDGEVLASSTLRLRSAKAWSWAVDVSMTAVCQMWAYKRMMTIDMAASIPLTGPVLLAAMQRKKDLTSTLVILCDYLGHVKSRSGETHISPICAELLSSPGKIHLCSWIERVALKLRGAFENFIQHARGEKVEPGSSDECKSVSILDSIVCIVALLDPAADQTLDFAQKTRRWYQVEKRRNSLTKMKAKSEYHVEDEPILGRLPAALFKIQRYESSLQRLLVVISKHREHIRQYDPLLRGLLENSESEDFHSRNIDLLSCLMERFVTRNAAHSALGMASIMNSEEELEECEYPIGPKHCNGDRPMSRKTARRYGTDALSRRRKVRRVIQRSRNETIDQWLVLDEQCDENPNVDDAFADLEDFVVPG